LQRFRTVVTDFQIGGQQPFAIGGGHGCPCRIERQAVSHCLMVLLKAIRLRVRNAQSLVYAPRIIFSLFRPQASPL
jgi:hypothetical protein